MSVWHKEDNGRAERSQVSKTPISTLSLSSENYATVHLGRINISAATSWQSWHRNDRAGLVVVNEHQSYWSMYLGVSIKCSLTGICDVTTQQPNLLISILDLLSHISTIQWSSHLDPRPAQSHLNHTAISVKWQSGIRSKATGCTGVYKKQSTNRNGSIGQPKSKIREKNQSSKSFKVKCSSLYIVSAPQMYI